MWLILDRVCLSFVMIVTLYRDYNIRPFIAALCLKKTSSERSILNGIV